MYDPHDEFHKEDHIPGEAPVETTYRVADLEKPPRRKRSWGKLVALCLVCALLGGAAGVGGAALYASQTRGSTTVYQSSRQPTAVTVANVPSDRELSAAEVYASNVDACVGINLTTTTNFFGYTTSSAVSGSGFVLTQDGYIVTNYHVIQEAAENRSVPITVTFQNGDTYQATLVGGEKDNDVAVLKIDASGLTPVVLGDSDELVVGQTVYAIGNPLGELTYSLTDGLVSALDRVITTGSGSDAASLNMLQTNCAINSGNSGGPLFNSYGEVIGITTAKMSSSNSSEASVEGLGFAIPINDVKTIIQDLIQYGYVTGKPYMGVTVSTVSASDAQRFGVPVGALVESVEEGSCAEKAGLQVSDIITAVGDTEVTTVQALTAAKATYRAGDTATLTVARDGQTLELSITFDEEPRQEEVTVQPSSSSGGSGESQWPSFFPFGF